MTTNQPLTELTLAPLDPSTADNWGGVLETVINNAIVEVNDHETRLQLVEAGAGFRPPPDATSSVKGILQLAGDLTGTAAAPVLKTVVSPGTFGSSVAIPVITVDAQGRVTAVSTTAPAGGGGGGGGLTVTDNGDGSITVGVGGTASIVDNNDGSLTIA